MVTEKVEVDNGARDLCKNNTKNGGKRGFAVSEK